jgi:hypothetical protein
VQAGRRVALRKRLVCPAQLPVQETQLLPVFDRKVFFKLLTEEGNAVIGTAVDRQATA